MKKAFKVILFILVFGGIGFLLGYFLLHRILN